MSYYLALIITIESAVIMKSSFISESTGCVRSSYRCDKFVIFHSTLQPLHMFCAGHEDRLQMK